MPEDVLNEEKAQIDLDKGEVNVKAEFDPEKESFLKQKSLDQENVEEQTIKTQENETTQTEDVNNILNDLEALDKAEDIKQNIERSKIASVNAQNFLAEIDSSTQKAWSEANAELSKISLHRSVIESEFESALKNFDIAAATKLEKQIIELSKQYTQKQAEANLVNLKLNEQLSLAFSKWKQWTAEFLDSIRNEDGYKKAYYIIEQVKSMDKEKAQALLAEPAIQSSLGVWLAPVKDFVERIGL